MKFDTPLGALNLPLEQIEFNLHDFNTVQLDTVQLCCGRVRGEANYQSSFSEKVERALLDLAGSKVNPEVSTEHKPGQYYDFWHICLSIDGIKTISVVITVVARSNKLIMVEIFSKKTNLST